MDVLLSDCANIQGVTLCWRLWRLFDMRTFSAAKLTAVIKAALIMVSMFRRRDNRSRSIFPIAYPGHPFNSEYPRPFFPWRIDWTTQKKPGKNIGGEHFGQDQCFTILVVFLAFFCAVFPLLLIRTCWCGFGHHFRRQC